MSSRCPCFTVRRDARREARPNATSPRDLGPRIRVASRAIETSLQKHGPDRDPVPDGTGRGVRRRPPSGAAGRAVLHGRDRGAAADRGHVRPDRELGLRRARAQRVPPRGHGRRGRAARRPDRSPGSARRSSSRRCRGSVRSPPTRRCRTSRRTSRRCAAGRCRRRTDRRHRLLHGRPAGGACRPPAPRGRRCRRRLPRRRPGHRRPRQPAPRHSATPGPSSSSATPTRTARCRRRRSPPWARPWRRPAWPPATRSTPVPPTATRWPTRRCTTRPPPSGTSRELAGLLEGAL